MATRLRSRTRLGVPSLAEGPRSAPADARGVRVTLSDETLRATRAAGADNLLTLVSTAVSRAEALIEPDRGAERYGPVVLSRDADALLGTVRVLTRVLPSSSGAAARGWPTTPPDARAIVERLWSDATRAPAPTWRRARALASPGAPDPPPNPTTATLGDRVASLVLDLIFCPGFTTLAGAPRTPPRPLDGTPSLRTPPSSPSTARRHSAFSSPSPARAVCSPAEPRPPDRSSISRAAGPTRTAYPRDARSPHDHFLGAIRATIVEASAAGKKGGNASRAPRIARSRFLVTKRDPSPAKREPPPARSTTTAATSALHVTGEMRRDSPGTTKIGSDGSTGYSSDFSEGPSRKDRRRRRRSRRSRNRRRIRLERLAETAETAGGGDGGGAADRFDSSAADSNPSLRSSRLDSNPFAAALASASADDRAALHDALLAMLRSGLPSSYDDASVLATYLGVRVGSESSVSGAPFEEAAATLAHVLRVDEAFFEHATSADAKCGLPLAFAPRARDAAQTGRGCG